MTTTTTVLTTPVAACNLKPGQFVERINKMIARGPRGGKYVTVWGRVGSAVTDVKPGHSQRARWAPS